jgi:hypothetical protein
MRRPLKLAVFVLASSPFWAHAQNVMADRTRLRVAVAQQEQQEVLALRLGRAVKFALFGKTATHTSPCTSP